MAGRGLRNGWSGRFEPPTSACKFDHGCARREGTHGSGRPLTCLFPDAVIQDPATSAGFSNQLAHDVSKSEVGEWLLNQGSLGRRQAAIDLMMLSSVSSPQPLIFSGVRQTLSPSGALLMSRAIPGGTS